MVTRQAQRLAKRSLWWAAIVFGMLVVALLIRGTWGVHAKMQEAKALKAHAEAEYRELMARKVELEAALANLETDRGIEAEIRERYPLVLPGEQEYLLIDRTDTATGTPPRQTLWQRLTGAVLGWW